MKLCLIIQKERLRIINENNPESRLDQQNKVKFGKDNEISDESEPHFPKETKKDEGEKSAQSSEQESQNANEVVITEMAEITQEIA